MGISIQLLVRFYGRTSQLLPLPHKCIICLIKKYIISTLQLHHSFEERFPSWRSFPFSSDGLSFFSETMCWEFWNSFLLGDLETSCSSIWFISFSFFLGGCFKVPIRSFTLYSRVLCGMPQIDCALDTLIFPPITTKIASSSSSVLYCRYRPRFFLGCLLPRSDSESRGQFTPKAWRSVS